MKVVTKQIFLKMKFIDEVAMKLKLLYMKVFVFCDEVAMKHVNKQKL